MHKPNMRPECLTIKNVIIMNKIRIVLSACFAVIIMTVGMASANAKSDGKAKMKFEETTHDFGMVKEKGGPVSCDFVFENVGDGNLIIYEAKAECGCTKPEFPKAPVAPGKSGVVKVTYNPLGRPGAFTKVVTVKTNGNPAKMRLKIRGTVVPEKQ